MYQSCPSTCQRFTASSSSLAVFFINIILVQFSGESISTVKNASQDGFFVFRCSDMAFQSDASGTVKAASRDYGRVYSCGLQDPDSVLGSLTHEIKEVGPDGQEVTKVVPAVTEEDQGIEILTEAIAACTETIDQHKGKLVVKETPRARTEHMAKLRMDDEEISGNEEEDTGMGEVDIEGAGIVE
ncbi:unnamed protein product [Brassica oleracea]